MTRADILAEASRIVTIDRNDQYGEPQELFGLIAKYWTAHLDRQVNAHDVAVMMALMKCARMQANPAHRDSAVDACGYLAIAGEVGMPRTEPQDAPTAASRDIPARSTSYSATTLYEVENGAKGVRV